MAIWNVIIIFVMIYYTFFFIGLTFKKKRIQLKNINTKLDNMRKIPVKNLEQQKEFINTKYPKPGKFKFTWKWLGKILLMILISIGLYRGYNSLFKYLNLEFAFWHVILIIILFPVIVNLVLRLFHLERDDITIFFR